jgi:hypothetical protein
VARELHNTVSLPLASASVMAAVPPWLWQDDRRGLATILDAHDDLQLAGEAADGEASLLTYERCKPDVVLMDMMMPLTQTHYLHGCDASPLFAALCGRDI